MELKEALIDKGFIIESVDIGEEVGYCLTCGDSYLKKFLVSRGGEDIDKEEVFVCKTCNSKLEKGEGIKPLGGIGCAL